MPRSSSSRKANAENQDGFALLSVLWLLLLATVLVASLAFWTTQGVRTRSLLSQDLETSRVLEAAFQIVVFDLITDGQESQWAAQSGPVVESLDVMGNSVVVTVSADAGKVDLNAADDALVLQVLKIAGASQSNADGRLFAIRDAQHMRGDLPKLATMVEVRSVFADKGKLFSCVEPLTTVHTGAKRPALEQSPARLRNALSGNNARRSVMSIASQQLSAQSFRLQASFNRRTVIKRFLLTGNPSEPYWTYSNMAAVDDSADCGTAR